MWQQVEEALRQSLARVITKMAILLPGVLALLAAVLIFVTIGALASFVLRRMLTAVKFDDRFERTNSTLSEWAPSRSPSLLVARVAFWGCVVLGLVVGIAAFDASYNSTAVIAGFLLPYVAHTVGAVVILIIGNILARFLARSILIGAVNMNLHYARFLSLGVKWLVLVLTAAMVLEHLGIGGVIIELAFGILFGGIVLTLSLAVGLGSKEMVSRSLDRDTLRRTEEPPRPLRHF